VAQKVDLQPDDINGLPRPVSANSNHNNHNPTLALDQGLQVFNMSQMTREVSSDCKPVSCMRFVKEPPVHCDRRKRVPLSLATLN